MISLHLCDFDHIFWPHNQCLFNEVHSLLREWDYLISLKVIKISVGFENQYKGIKELLRGDLISYFFKLSHDISIEGDLVSRLEDMRNISLLSFEDIAGSVFTGVK